MSDVFLASLLVIGGVAWTVIWVSALFDDPNPAPSRLDGTMLALLAGPAATLAGLVWWAVIIVSWVL